MRAVLVDYGEVISRPQSQQTLRTLAELTELEVPELEQRYWEHRPPYDRGGEASTFWSTVTGRPVSEGTLRRLVEVDIQGWLEFDEEALTVLREARQRGVGLSLLSNAPRELADALSAEPSFRVFDHLLFSSRLGVVKPEPAIFELAIEKLGVEAAEIAFVDDRESNVEAGETAGLQAILFTSPRQLRAELLG